MITEIFIFIAAFGILLLFIGYCAGLLVSDIEWLFKPAMYLLVTGSILLVGGLYMLSS